MPLSTFKILQQLSIFNHINTELKYFIVVFYKIAINIFPKWVIFSKGAEK